MQIKKLLAGTVISMLISNNIHAAEYFYDDLNRLVRVEYESGICIEYEYDDSGNIRKVITRGLEESPKDGETEEDQENPKENPKENPEKDIESHRGDENQGSSEISKVQESNKVDEEQKNTTISKLILTMNSNIAIYNGQTMEMDATVMISKSNRLLIPIRYLVYVLNISPEQIKWHAKTKEVEILGNKRIVVGIGETYMLVDGIEVPLLEKAQVINGRTYLPIGDICRAFELNYSWDNTTKQLSIVRK